MSSNRVREFLKIRNKINKEIEIIVRGVNAKEFVSVGQGFTKCNYCKQA